VDAILEAVSAEVDAALTGLGYTVPITGTLSLAVVRKGVAMGALEQILNARAFAVGRPQDQGADVAGKRYRDWLTRLSDPTDRTAVLPDAKATDALAKDPADQVRGMGTDLVADDYDPDVPAVTMGQVF
jgi:hypothetical protein